MSAELKTELTALLRAKGAALVGVADLRGVQGADMPVGVAVAIPVPPHITADLTKAPTREYYEAYAAMNARLDDIVLCGEEFLRSRGFRALANTTKRVKKDADWRTPLPHKTVAVRAGLGWIGKSCLLVTREYGGAVRLSALLTDAPMRADAPVRGSLCGACEICVKSCPAGALTGVAWREGVAREQMLNKEACKREQTERMKRATGIETDLCGKCFAVCPYTQGYLRRAGVI